MENQIQQEDLFDVEIDATAKSLISDIATWAKIVAVSAFVGYAISLVAAVLGKNELGSGFAATTSKATEITGTLINVIIGAIINIFLFRFAVEAKRGIDHIDQERLESGFNNLRIYYKILGVFIIIILAIFVFVLLAVVMGGGIPG